MFGIVVSLFAMATAGLVIKLSDAPALAIAFWRLFLTSIILLPFAAYDKFEELRNLSKRDIGILTIIGLAYAIHFSFWITSLKYTTVATSIILVDAHPIFVALGGRYFYDEKITKYGTLGIVLAFCGIATIGLGQGALGSANFIGAIFALIGGIMSAVYILLGKQQRQKVGIISYSFYVYLTCSIFIMIAMLIMGVPAYPYSIKEYSIFVYLAIVPTILGHSVCNWALKYVPANSVSVMLLGEPIAASLLAYFLLSEIPVHWTIVGAIMILVGVYVTLQYGKEMAFQTSE
jgi:drug/metabolite transporter (DMT)-like permease